MLAQIFIKTESIKSLLKYDNIVTILYNMLKYLKSFRKVMLKRRTIIQNLQFKKPPFNLIFRNLKARLFSRPFSSCLCLISFERFSEVFKTLLELTNCKIY